MVPTSLILDCKLDLRAFKNIVLELDMPTMDLEAVLSQVCDALRNEIAVTLDVTELAYEMSKGESLFENSDLEDDAKERVFKAVKELGMSLHSQLADINAYRDGRFPYTFKALLNNDSILLSATPEAAVGWS